MRKWIRILPVLLGLLLPTIVHSEMTPAFPGAEGFGRYITGGRGGTVYHVTSLADDGSVGTFRWALNQGGKRTIVFDISGTIHLDTSLAITSGNVTIAGQSAPGDGICVADFPFTINASNVIIRFMRFRLGNLRVASHEGDGLGGMDQQNIIVDHCSVSWSIDECCSVYGNQNQTVQWCIVSQSLRNAGHAKGPHGYGGIWGGSGASFHHNLLAHHDSRTPRFGPRAGTQTDERMDMRNNVIYNWAGNGCYGGEGMNVNIVNNYYKPGPGTKQKSEALQYRIAAINIRTIDYCNNNPSFAPMLHVWGKFYAQGNLVDGNAEVTADNWTKGIYAQISNESNDYLYTPVTKDTMKLAAPIDYIYTTTHTPSVAYEKVLQYAGASYSRDWVDSLMVSDTRNGVASHTGTGIGNVYGIIDSQQDNKPVNAPADWNAWPVLKSTPCPLDTDSDGMPDSWETAKGLNPNNALDRNVLDKDGFTMLELYLNSLVAPIMMNENENGTPSGAVIDDLSGISTKVTLNSTFYIGAATAPSPWAFNGGYSITNADTKTYATGSELGVKFSKGVKFTVNLPSGIQVDTVKFIGYDNYAGTDSYLSELNGTTYASTDYVFTQKTVSGTYVLCSHAIPFATPATDSFTFTFGGNQTVCSIILSIKSYSDIKPVFTSLDPNEQVNVYGIDGRIIRPNVARKQAVNGLPKGIFIVDGQKIAVSK
ncbi:MAG TPA: pectate lyase [Bacteroidales bacterium]|nr:pectate lyase [Bacteroidales bacterium]